MFPRYSAPWGTGTLRPPPETVDESAARRACLRAIPAAQILADVTAILDLCNRHVHDVGQIPILATNVNVSGVRAHREPCDENAIDQLVRIVLDQDAVL